tara:strand:+ start:895 stop:3006 length:2112 start_codon:yes stop_codon:yes gene_type:complete
MPSTIYRGDLAEISFGHESGLYFEYDVPRSLRFTIENDASHDTATIKFTASHGSDNLLVDSSQNLMYPKNLLVGAKVRIKSASTYSSDDLSTGAVFTVVANNEDEIEIAPRLTHSGLSSAVAAAAGDAIMIGPLGVPSPDISNFTYHTSSAVTAESVLTDQFVGLVSNITLPETKVDIKRYQVVGLGRDVAVQAPGRYTHTGGSFEVNLHNARWFYYCLGTEVAKASAAANPFKIAGGTDPQTPMYLDADIAPGQNWLQITATGWGGGSAMENVRHTAEGTLVAVGDYVVVNDAQVTVDSGTANNYLLPVVQHREVELASGKPAALNIFGSGSDAPHISPVEATRRYEIRRIVGINAAGRIYVDDPFNFAHEATTDTVLVTFFQFNSDDSEQSPNLITTGTTAGSLQNPVTRLIYSRSTVPSFALETSIRNRDLGSYGTSNAEQDEAAPGSTNDTKQLTRIFKGCKVTSFTFTADTDAAARLQVNFDSQMEYTDTGRLDSGDEVGDAIGDRFIAHRMFENTANTPAARKEAGIESGTQKPFFFYDGTLTLGGRSIARATSFTLTGNNNTTQIYTIGGNPQDSGLTADTLVKDAIPFGGKHSPSDVVEGKTDYSLSMEVILDDPIFLHELRSAKSFSDKDDSIRLSFLKQGATGTREQMTIWLEDFMLSEAPIPIPEDKGAVRATLNILPKTMRVVATDTLGHS